MPRSASVTLLSQARVRIQSAACAHRAPVLESSLSEALAPALDQLFHQGRTLHGWTDRPVEQALLVRLYETLRMAPTAFNSQPLRLIFVTSPEAKERLVPALQPSNVEQTRQAPVTAIVAFDTAFHTHLTTLLPQWPVAAAHVGGLPAPAREQIGIVNASLQAGYLMIVARGLGLDVGPMTGLDTTKVDAAFFADGSAKTIMCINLGYGAAETLRPRGPRLDFDMACSIA
ncbi:MAG: malonic semialdehyde reductase [Deltaproteobacteria bacterium]|nr:malonic semialdehyde reductase [Deltaproteobacteria bacterium]